MGKGKFVVLSTVFGLLGYAVVAAISGFIFDMMGNRHPHGPGPVLVAIIAAIYIAPLGALIGLIASLVMQNRSGKKMALILGVGYVVIIAALVLYVKVLAGRA